MIKPGMVIRYRDLRWVVFGSGVFWEGSQTIPGLTIMADGGLKQVRADELNKFAKVLESERPEYIEVSQFNYKEVLESYPDGSVKKSKTYHKAPSSYEEAVEWSQTMGGINFADTPRVHWGCGTYKLTSDNTYELVGGKWDSSG